MGKSPLEEKGGAGEEAKKTPTKPKQKNPTEQYYIMHGANYSVEE